MDVIAMARQLGKALQQDEGYLRLMVAQQQNDADETLQALIGKFNLARINLNTELNKTDKDQARVTALNEEVRAVYGQIMDNENMAAYNKAKTEFDDTVDLVMHIIRGIINGEDPDLIEKQSGCSGSCSSCSGCS